MLIPEVNRFLYQLQINSILLFRVDVSALSLPTMGFVCSY